MPGVSSKKKADVAIIMGSSSDMPKMEAAIETLKEFGVSHHVEIVSAHRTPEKMQKFGKAASKNHKIIIAGAGGAAHLPGMVASFTTLPVIGVPVLVGDLEGLDALLSIAQMPKGVPVATVGVDNSRNAGLLAVRMLSMSSSRLKKKLEAFEKSQKTKVKLQNKEITTRL